MELTNKELYKLIKDIEKSILFFSKKENLYNNSIRNLESEVIKLKEVDDILNEKVQELKINTKTISSDLKNFNERTKEDFSFIKENLKDIKINYKEINKTNTKQIMINKILAWLVGIATSIFVVITGFVIQKIFFN